MRLLYVGVLVVFIVLVGHTAWNYFQKKQSGIVIILNGPSASGKSSIQQSFQKLMMPDLWIKVGIDNLFDLPMPDITPENLQYWQNVNPIRWVTSTKDQYDKPVITLYVGEQGEKVAYGMNSAIAAYAQNGCNIIVDYIAYDQNWLKDLKKKLKDIKTFYVKVEISLDTLEQREAARATSPQGHARSHFNTVYGDQKYDLVVHTESYSSDEIAKQIKDHIQKH